MQVPVKAPIKHIVQNFPTLNYIKTLLLMQNGLKNLKTLMDCLKSCI